MVKFNNFHLDTRVPSWELPADQQTCYNDLSFVLRTANTVQISGVDFDMIPNLFFHRNAHINTLPPSPPLSLCSFVTPSTPVEARGIRSDTPVAVSSPKSSPTVPVIMEATDSMRIRARAMIWDDVPHIKDNFMCLDSESSSENEETFDAGSYSSSRRQRLMARASGKLRKAYTHLEKSVEKVEHNALKRTFVWAKKGVNKFKPLKSLLKGVTRRAKPYELFTKRDWDVSTFSIAKLSKPNSPGTSTWSLVGPIVSDGEDPSNLRTGAQAQFHRSPFPDTESAFSWRGDVDRSDEAVQAPINQFKQHTESHTAKAAQPSSRNVSTPERPDFLSAQIAAFRFSTLVPMEILQGWGPTHRVILKTSNTLLAQHDLIKLSHIWSQAISDKSSPLWLACHQPLRSSSDTDAEKLCKLMEEALHRFTYWSLFARFSMKEKEGAMDENWWSNFGKKLSGIGHPNSEALYDQLVAVGLKYIDVDALETAMALTNALNLVDFPDKELVSQNREANYTDDETKLPVLAQMEKVITSEPSKEFPSKQAATPLVPKLQSRHSIPVCQLPTTAISNLVLQNETCERRVLPSHNLCLARKKVVAKENYDEELTLPADENASTGSASSSPDMMKEVIASLDAAIGQPISSPDPMKERMPSQIPRPLTTRKSQPTIFKPNSTNMESSRQKRQDSPHEPVSPQITRENGWISAVDLGNFNPANIAWEDVVYAGPSNMSNKAKGKLPVDRHYSNTSVSSRSFPKITQPQTLSQSTITSRSVSKPVAPRVAPRSGVKSQGNSTAGPPGHNAMRSISLGTVQTPWGCSVEIAPRRSASKTMPPRPRAHSQGSYRAGPVGHDVTRLLSLGFTRKPLDVPVQSKYETKTSCISPRPVVTHTTAQNATANFSVSLGKSGCSEVQLLRTPSGPTLPGSPSSGIPVPQRTVCKPGTFVGSDRGFGTQRYRPEDICQPELALFPVVTIHQDTPPRTSYNEDFVFVCPEDLQSPFTNATIASAEIPDLQP